MERSGKLCPKVTRAGGATTLALLLALASCRGPADAEGTAASAVASVDCSQVQCTAADQPTLSGYQMFDESYFDPVVDGFGVTRKFYVHIPDSYDTVDGVTQKIPLVFAFHGGGQTREAMIGGKWGDYFNDDIAFVIPKGEVDPCDGAGDIGWMQPTVGPRSTPSAANCDPASEVFDPAGKALTYWNTSLEGTFVDVNFVESLKWMIFRRFPKINESKVYATGFSSGGGLAFSLLCYRSGSYRGFSVVAKTLSSDAARGDYDGDGIDDVAPQSLNATCGRTVYDGYPAATGIGLPDLWGTGTVFLYPTSVFGTETKPIALFVGDQDDHTNMAISAAPGSSSAATTT